MRNGIQVQLPLASDFLFQTCNTAAVLKLLQELYTEIGLADPG